MMCQTAEMVPVPDPHDHDEVWERASAARIPMCSVFRTLDVTAAVRAKSPKRRFHALMCYAAWAAAKDDPLFYTRPARDGGYERSNTL